MLETRNLTKKRPPTIKFGDLLIKVLGKTYDLSLVIADDKTSQKLNRIYRKKNKPANVLSFPYSEKSGEIILNIEKALREAREENVSLRDRMLLLYVHGLAHLKGFRHGRAMDTFEKKMRDSQSKARLRRQK